MKFIFYSQQNCEFCEDALPLAKKISEKHGVSLKIVDVEETSQIPDDVYGTPALCLKDGKHVRCWVGSESIEKLTRAKIPPI